MVNFTGYRLIRRTLKMSAKYSRAKKNIKEPKGAEHGLEEKNGGGHRRLCIFHPST